MCLPCSKRKSARLRDTSQPTVPVRPSQTNNSAQAQGDRMRGKLRFTGR